MSSVRSESPRIGSLDRRSTTPPVDWFALSPTLALLAAGARSACSSRSSCPALDGGRSRRSSARSAFVGAIVPRRSSSTHSADGTAVIADAIVRDQLGAAARDHHRRRRPPRRRSSSYSRADAPTTTSAEYYALLASAGAGMVFLVGATNLMTLFLGLEWFSICLYILCAIDERRSTARSRPGSST